MLKAVGLFAVAVSVSAFAAVNSSRAGNIKLVPYVLEKTEAGELRLSLEYFGCSQVHEESCAPHTLTCSPREGVEIGFEFKGFGIGYLAFSNIVSNSHNAPSIAPNTNGYRKSVSFGFVRAERIGKTDSGSWKVVWKLPQSDNSGLLKMIATNENLKLTGFGLFKAGTEIELTKIDYKGEDALTRFAIECEAFG